MPDHTPARLRPERLAEISQYAETDSINAGVWGRNCAERHRAELLAERSELLADNERLTAVAEVWQRGIEELNQDGADARHELERVNAELRKAGYAYPLGARGVHDMANHLDQYRNPGDWGIDRPPADKTGGRPMERQWSYRSTSESGESIGMDMHERDARQHVADLRRRYEGRSSCTWDVVYRNLGPWTVADEPDATAAGDDTTERDTDPDHRVGTCPTCGVRTFLASNGNMITHVPALAPITVTPNWCAGSDQPPENPGQQQTDTKD